MSVVCVRFKCVCVCFFVCAYSKDIFTLLEFQSVHKPLFIPECSYKVLHKSKLVHQCALQAQVHIHVHVHESLTYVTFVVVNICTINT